MATNVQSVGVSVSETWLSLRFELLKHLKRRRLFIVPGLAIVVPLLFYIYYHRQHPAAANDFVNTSLTLMNVLILISAAMFAGDAICGEFEKKTSLLLLGDQQLLDRMVNSIRHEQWYKVDRYVSPPFNIARVHLGIFNPEPQPFFNEDKTLRIFMDGKVYGYDDEKRRLEGKHHFTSDTDPEFCLHLYEELGGDN